MKSASRISWTFLVAAILTAGLSCTARADDDPPGRIARLNFAQGSVSFEPAGGGDNDWTAAVVNRPMSTGDRLWTDQDGRAELHIGSTAIHLDHETGISFLSLADNGIQLQLSAGTTTIRLRRLDPNDSFEVDAPNLAFSPVRPGTYRIDVDPDRNVTVVSVVEGQGTVIGGARSYNLIPDQRATFTGTDSLQYDLADVHTSRPSDFDNWAASRDQQEDRFASAPTARYVPPEMTGCEDLDTYGAWRTVPDYGPMWVPASVAVGWAPYRFGHWVWMAPWGWTWIEDEPWGFAPFHYGRWVYVGGIWGWVPGPVAVRPVYAPALVAWVGGTPGFSFSVSIGGGGIGWFPLGPREVFVPGYRVSDAYVTRVNVTNTIVERTTVINVYHNNVTNINYVNRRVNGGVTVVSHDTFINARPVGRNVVAVNDRDLARAPVQRTFSAAPVHSSLAGEGRPAAARPPAAIINRTVVRRRTPPPQPRRFEEQPGAGQFGGRDNNQPNQNQPNQPTNRGFAPGQQQPNRGESQPPARTIQPSQPPTPAPPQSSPQPPNRGEGQPPTRGFEPSQQQPNRGDGQLPARTIQPTPPPSQPQPSPTQAQPGNRPAPRVFEQQSAPPQPQQPTQPQPQQAPQQPQLRSGAGGGFNRNEPAQPAANPMTRPAPPVRQPTPAERQTDATKQGQWQQQHQQVHGKDGGGGNPPDKQSGRDNKKH